ncbi:SMP-30/gluconolactonase/LRE family protein [Cyclobacterium marinum]|uniref:SMP-30/Gluconolaconase/LRE-like region-containing protein n=1 Tax=Cyclobacterium marinum (strain ATCC 25205 / DSM 745 / LMG 13164 / NCIMB 1802) TaxID=880070 RepID=G0IZS1_CYCMS|nr:SMP-30/gluconolactonase/LRE family protein [Cyclobacterium marinum]AEL25735.1 SMP-30/Gluconolaconase/LRE-like region-containing protein [Cyclobacterium marinum DSM 745]|tara:strand:- start:69893 stop:70825 length:933 start_codon:yes stop_codon:yes gene_type:complete
MIKSIINRMSLLALLMAMGACSSKSSKTESKEMETEENLYVSQPFTSKSEFTGGIEGPAVDKEGNLYVVNFGKEGTIGKVTPDGKASLFVTLPEGSTGNGIRFNSKGEMLIADYTGHNVLKVDMQSLEISVYAHHDDLNQPNDIAIMDNDIVFASDPNWKESTGQIWRVGLDGQFVLLEADMGTTNGIEVSPDNRTLYVNESVQRTVWAYDLSETGEISNKRLIHTFEDFGMDGMRVDIDGDLYVTRHGKGTVVKLSPEGEFLKEIKMSGDKPSNIAFGGEDGKTAYVTLQDNGNIDSFLVEKPGRAFKK